MIFKEAISRHLTLNVLTIAIFTLCLQTATGANESIIDINQSETTEKQNKHQKLGLEERVNINYDAYILGPGDGLQIEVLDLPELSGNFSIGPDGTLYVPRLRALYVEGLTVEELRTYLTQKFRTYVRDPQIYVRPVKFRPIRVYVGGEVKRPGYYTLTGVQSVALNDTRQLEMQPLSWNGGLTQTSNTSGSSRAALLPTVFDARGLSQTSNTSGSSTAALLPTVFDAIRSAQGVTPYTDLAQVQVIRKRAKSLGGGRIKTNLNFLSLITEGNDSQNIRLFDGDILSIGKSPIVLRDQLLKAGQSNLSPQFVNVFVIGRVNMPGRVQIPQGSSLNQAITLAGGTKLLKGKVEFVRFNREGTIDRRIFAYKPGASADAPNNPVLAAGDLIRINDSILSGSLNVISELTSPIIGLYSVYSLFNLTQ